MTPGARPPGALPVRVYQAVFVLLVVLKLWLVLAAPPIGDEAYYWIWGQKLAWSYFDHPPLQAWLLHSVAWVFGWTLLGLRILTLATFAGTLWIVWLWSKRLRPEHPSTWFWPSAALYLSSPLLFFMSSITFNDHLLVFLCLASGHLFLVFSEKWEVAGRGFAWLYAAAFVLGLAVLTKYNGVLLALGVALWFAARPQLRPLWRSPHLYLAAGLSVAMQAPVLWWNITKGFASYRFHLSERWGGGGLHFSPSDLGAFLLLAVLVVSPFLLPAIFAFVRRQLGNDFANRARGLAVPVFAVSTLVMLALSMFVQVVFYWNIVAFVLLIPLIAGWVRNRWLATLQLAYGTLLAAGIAVNFALVPLSSLAGGLDWTTSSAFGWPETAQRIEALEAEHAVGFIAATRYTTAAQLAFALRDPEVTAIDARHDQYDFWFAPAAHDGEDALVVSDPQLGIDEVSRHFENLTELEQVPFIRFGQTIYRPTIYLGHRFRADTFN